MIRPTRSGCEEYGSILRMWAKWNTDMLPCLNLQCSSVASQQVQKRKYEALYIGLYSDFSQSKIVSHRKARELDTVELTNHLVNLDPNFLFIKIIAILHVTKLFKFMQWILSSYKYAALRNARSIRIKCFAHLGNNTITWLDVFYTFTFFVICHCSPFLFHSCSISKLVMHF